MGCCECCELQEKKSKKAEYALLISSAILFASAFFLPRPIIGESVFILALLLSGWEVFLTAFKNIMKGRIFDENFLMAIAAMGAVAIKEPAEGAAVILFYRVGELMERLAAERSKRSIKSLMTLRPDYANLNGERVPPESVRIGDIISVLPGERVPLDGVLLSGSSSVNTSAVTGEPLPGDISEGDEVLSGFVNGAGVFTMRVTKEYSESTVNKIIQLVQSARERKTKSERFITTFARIYTPAVVTLALFVAVVPPLFIPSAPFSEWARRALIFLVISCPCALVISVPLSFFAGIGLASRRGILIKGSSYLESLCSADTLAIDKTGTLTYGELKIKAIEGENPDLIKRYASLAEKYSSHPIAKRIISEFGEAEGELFDYNEDAGHGISAQFEGGLLLAGNARLMAKHGINHPPAQGDGIAVFIAFKGEYLGCILLDDALRPSSEQAMSELSLLGIKRTVMLTGDSARTAQAVANEAGVSKFEANLLPHQKAEHIDKLRRESSGGVIFVGDGINDAPSLALADVGIAMGGGGIDAAIEAADVVIMTDEPLRIPLAIRIARLTRCRATQNIVFSLAVKAAIMLLSVFGLANMWIAVFADVGVSLIAILNALRVPDSL